MCVERPTRSVPSTQISAGVLAGIDGAGACEGVLLSVGEAAVTGLLERPLEGVGVGCMVSPSGLGGS